MSDAAQYKVIKRECGGWLAVATPSCRFRIGIVGDTEEEAASLFEASLGKWEASTPSLTPSESADPTQPLPHQPLRG